MDDKSHFHKFLFFDQFTDTVKNQSKNLCLILFPIFK